MTWPAPHAAERHVVLTADPEMRAVLQRELDVEEMRRLSAEIAVRAWLDGMEIEGRIDALMTRLCGVTLDPFDVTMEEPFKVRVVPLGSPNAPRSENEIVVELEAEDPPDEAGEAGVDLGAYVIEALTLALDPFPRKPGAVFEPAVVTDPISPFAALAGFVKKPPLD